jgi:hypothetical protein
MRKRVVRVAAVVIAVLCLAGQSEAQTAIAVDINRAKLSWDWVQVAPTDSIPDDFVVKCGQSTGNYTKLTPVVFPTKQVAVKDAIAGNGSWFCVVTARNQFGESLPSNEVNFTAGNIPGSATNLTVSAQ